MSLWRTSSYWFIQDNRGNVVFSSAYGLVNGRAGLLVATYTFSESGNAAITVYRTLGSDGPIELSYATADGTGVAGVDYTAVSGTLLWGDKDVAPKTILVPLIRTAGTTDKTFTFTVANIPPFAFTIGPYATATVTIHRDGPGELDLVGAAYAAQDPFPAVSATLTLKAQRFNGFKGAAGCSWHTADGTALAGVDYTAASGTLSWADAEGGTKDIVVTILGRSGAQPDRNFTVTIDTPTGVGVIGATAVATVTITDAAPPVNPTPGGSIPQQLFDDMLGDGGGLTWKPLLMLDDQFSVSRVNIQFAGILAQKIGSWIGFAPGTSTGGGGTDPVNLDPGFSATPANRTRVRRMNYKERL